MHLAKRSFSLICDRAEKTFLKDMALHQLVPQLSSTQNNPYQFSFIRSGFPFIYSLIYYISSFIRSGFFCSRFVFTLGYAFFNGLTFPILIAFVVVWIIVIFVAVAFPFYLVRFVLSEAFPGPPRIIGFWSFVAHRARIPNRDLGFVERNYFILFLFFKHLFGRGFIYRILEMSRDGRRMGEKKACIPFSLIWTATWRASLSSRISFLFSNLRVLT